jgi:methionyl-tRNA formyltransferase
MRFAFAGDRAISVRVLNYLMERGDVPEYLLVADGERASHVDELIAISGLPEDRILRGSVFREPVGLKILTDAGLDLMLSIHFPYLVTGEVIHVAKDGILNLHPSYLPWNRGWHTPTWCILDGTPAGGTLHYMNEGIDTGDIIDQAEVQHEPWETADTLYAKILDAEFEVFVRHWPVFCNGKSVRCPQELESGTSHLRADLRTSHVQRLDLDEVTSIGDVITRLRALTTSRPHEAAFFEVDGQRVHVQVTLTPHQKD